MSDRPVTRSLRAATKRGGAVRPTVEAVTAADQLAVTPPAARQPNDKEAARIRAARERWAGRTPPPQVTTATSAPGEMTVSAPDHDDASGVTMRLGDTLGSRSPEFLGQALTTLEMTHRARGASSRDDRGMNAGLAIVAAIHPEDELEAALAVQMAGCHALTVDMLSRAKSTDSVHHIQLYGNLAVKLQRTFTAQVEALARLRGKGQQTVRGEHGTVAPGAQAVIGDVHHHQAGGGVTPNQETQPHGTRSAAASAALPSPDPTRNGVPVPSNAERPVPDARRHVARRTTRQPKRT